MAAMASAPAQRPASLMELLCTPRKSRAPAAADDIGAKQSPEKAAMKSGADGGGGSSSARIAVDEATGKFLQKRVSENKTKEAELRRAADLLEEKAGLFASAAEGPGEVAEEPGDDGAADDAEVPASRERRLASAAAAWPAQEAASRSSDAAPSITSAAFDPASAPWPGRAALPQRAGSSGAGAGAAPFAVLLPALEAAAQAGGEALLLRGVANVARLLRALSADKAAELVALARVLQCKAIPHKQLADAVAAAFALPRPSLRACAPEELAERALAGRLRQRSIFGGAARRPSLSEVAAVVESSAVGDQLVKLLSSSSGEGRETLHLVKLLQGRAGFGGDVALRALAHAFALASSPSAGSPDRASALVDFEDAVLQAHGQQRSALPRLVAALLEGKSGRELVSACPPECGRPVALMRSEQAKDIQAALAKLQGPQKPAVLAERLLQGVRLQVHAQGGKVVGIFDSRGEERPEVLEELSPIFEAGLRLGADLGAILDVVVLRPAKRGAGGGASSASTAAAGKVSDDEAAKAVGETVEGEKAARERAVAVLDLLFLSADPALTERPLRVRRRRLQQDVLIEGPRLKLAPGAELRGEELSEDAVRQALEDALGAACLASSLEEKAFSRADGVVLKLLDGPDAAYVAGRSSPSWQALTRPPLTGPEADEKLFATLTDEERKHLPDVSEFHFTVVSGFRTRSVEGINDILRIQQLYNDAGIVPTWYVDDECPEEYRKLGLTVVQAGKLLPARNRALIDAEALNKVCVQTSDDIGSWTYFNDSVKYNNDEEANAAAKRCEKLEVSPVAAARYLVALMRSRGPGKCRLGGVYPLGNAGRAMRGPAVAHKHFILGDFFAAEVSPCRFDERMSLKEDYDFTCSHLEAFGEVVRCNRLIITAKHETNAGGACAIRDAAGERERYNIGVLKEKWPDAIKNHPTRANQVVLRWKTAKRKADEDANAADPSREQEQAPSSSSDSPKAKKAKAEAKPAKKAADDANEADRKKAPKASEAKAKAEAKAEAKATKKTKAEAKAEAKATKKAPKSSEAPKAKKAKAEAKPKAKAKAKATEAQPTTT